MSNKIFVVDLEATMAADNNGSKRSDIVEIGVSIVDCATMSIAECFGFMLRPVTQCVGPALTELTGITHEDVSSMGFELRSIIGMLPTMWRTLRHPWASWGLYDKLMIESVCERYDYRIPFHKEHYNLKRLYWLLRLRCQGRPMSLDKALENEGMDFVGKRHRAKDDAYMASLLLLKMMEAI